MYKTEYHDVVDIHISPQSRAHTDSLLSVNWSATGRNKGFGNVM